MFKSVLDYFGTSQDGGSNGDGGSSWQQNACSDPLVNNIVDVGGHKVLVKRKIGTYSQSYQLFFYVLYVLQKLQGFRNFKKLKMIKKTS